MMREKIFKIQMQIKQKENFENSNVSKREGRRRRRSYEDEYGKTLAKENELNYSAVEFADDVDGDVR